MKILKFRRRILKIGNFLEEESLVRFNLVIVENKL